MPDSLKQALHAHATGRGLTLNSALVDLVERGLEASQTRPPIERLQRKLAVSRSELEKTRARLQEAAFRLQAAREREETPARIYRAVAERARQQLAPCPRCREPVAGYDLLVSGRCPSCEKALTSLLALAPRAGLALVGALGVLVGLAMASTAESAG